jgi:hypothetical protein
MYGWVLRDFDHRQIALQITDSSSRQRWRPKTKSKAIARQKKGGGESGHGPKEVPDTKTDRPTDRRSQHQLNSTQLNSTVYWTQQ